MLKHGGLSDDDEVIIIMELDCDEITVICDKKNTK